MTRGPLLFAVYKLLRLPSGRTVRKYRSRSGTLTEDLRHRWLTESRAQAEEMVWLLGNEWALAEVST